VKRVWILACYLCALVRAAVTLASAVLSMTFYVTAVGVFLSLVADANWDAIAEWALLTFAGYLTLLFAHRVSVACSTYAAPDGRGGYLCGYATEPTDDTKVVPTLPGLLGGLFYDLVSGACTLVMWAALEEEVRKELHWIVSAAACTGMLVGFVLGLQAARNILWRPGLLRTDTEPGPSQTAELSLGAWVWVALYAASAKLLARCLGFPLLAVWAGTLVAVAVGPAIGWYGNYTEERDKLFADMTLDDIVSEIQQERRRADTGV